MSGTNKIIQSVMEGKKASQSALTNALMNANNVAISIQGGKKKEEPKKK